jgi:hypothetical protein
MNVECSQAVEVVSACRHTVPLHYCDKQVAELLGVEGQGRHVEVSGDPFHQVTLVSL